MLRGRAKPRRKKASAMAETDVRIEVMTMLEKSSLVLFQVDE